MSGFPTLASDPHLDLGRPSTFYQAHVTTTEGLNVNGATFPGAPGVILGCNDTICWGATVNPMDVTDIYQEVLVALSPGGLIPTHTLFDGEPEPLVVIPQTFFVNQLGDDQPNNLADAGVGPLEGGVTLVVPRRNDGPIVRIDVTQRPVTALSVQYTGWGATRELDAFRKFQRTQNPSEFAEALQYFDVGSQNFAYACRRIREYRLLHQRGAADTRRSSDPGVPRRGHTSVPDSRRNTYSQA